MRVAVISDLHLSAHPLLDQFRHTEAAFLRFLDRLEDRHDRIVLLGDIYQTDQGVGPASHARQLEIVRDRHPRLVERFDLSPYIYIHGNHDRVSGRTHEVPDMLTLEFNGQRLRFMHGHQFDPLIEWVPRVAAFGTWLGGWIRRLGLGPVADLLERLDTDGKAGVRAPEKCPLRRAAQAMIATDRLDVVVMGHTHHAQNIKLGDGYYLNSGTCSGGRLCHLSLDTWNRDYRIVNDK